MQFIRHKDYVTLQQHHAVLRQDAYKSLMLFSIL